MLEGGVHWILRPSSSPVNMGIVVEDGMAAWMTRGYLRERLTEERWKVEGLNLWDFPRWTL